MAVRESSVAVASREVQEKQVRTAENPADFMGGTYTEDPDYNQYWYSPNTIRVMIEEIEQLDGDVAFLSTPSLYFSASEQCRSRSKMFDFDKKWNCDPNFVFYDFNKPEELPESLLHTFDVAVIDPPFITEDVWIKYGRAAELLLRKHDECKIICTTVLENESLLNKIFGVKPTTFQPSIPHLVYQYNLFVNFQSRVFSKSNPEITNST